jgi:hypothetical protein
MTQPFQEQDNREMIGAMFAQIWPGKRVVCSGPFTSFSAVMFQQWYHIRVLLTGQYDSDFSMYYCPDENAICGAAGSKHPFIGMNQFNDEAIEMLKGLVYDQ